MHADHKKSNWLELNQMMYELVQDQVKEVRKAIYKMSEYHFKSNYSHLEVERTQWFKMTPQQRQKQLEKVLSAETIAFECPGETSCRQCNFSENKLSVQPEMSGITVLSTEVLLRMWRKAEQLINTPNSICDAPGMENAKCVASTSGSKPHIVTISKKGLVNCDEQCIAWKSQRICSHTLAAAEAMGCLEVLYSAIP